ncbi:MAG TPA: hypothetical protein DDX92_09090 [Flavobacteriales bacterium]|jgi:hypothetical protein|nr:hypothetical protein [Flavobacteriales bacterium]
MEDNTKSSNRQQVILIVLLAVVAIIGIYLAYVNRSLKNDLKNYEMLKGELEEEKTEIMGNLKDLSLSYDSLMTNNDSINEELIVQKSKVERLIAEAKNNKWTIYKLRKEAETLRGIMKGYVRTIDSLNTANIELQAENIQVRSQLDEQKGINQELSKTNEDLAGKVKIGGRLIALDMIAYAQRIKNNGVHRETRRASKAQKIKVCFTLSANEIAKSGNKALYVRILTPTGQVLAERSDQSHMFNFEGTTGLYSIKKMVKYENQELDVCMYFDISGSVTAGEYMVKSYADEMEIGNATFTLK